MIFFLKAPALSRSSFNWLSQLSLLTLPLATKPADGKENSLVVLLSFFFSLSSCFAYCKQWIDWLFLQSSLSLCMSCRNSEKLLACEWYSCPRFSHFCCLLFLFLIHHWLFSMMFLREGKIYKPELRPPSQGKCP